MTRCLVTLLLCAAASSASAAIRPFAEYETVKYVAMSAGFDYQTQEAKLKILSHLPEEVGAIIYTNSPTDLEIFQKQSTALRGRRLEFMTIRKHGETLWPRDSWPYPVFDGERASLVDAPYSLNFEPDEAVAARFSVPMRRHEHVFEHGNLSANRLGDCLVVMDNFAIKIPDAAFAEHYGCRNVLRFPFIAGIGHADEVVKFMADDLVLTDQPSFVPTLKERGFRVAMLPQAKLPAELARRGVMPQRSYLNSLLVNGTVFVPVFDLPTDDEAVSIYESLGLAAVRVNSTYFADYGGGGPHCMTMTYPEFPVKEIPPSDQ